MGNIFIFSLIAGLAISVLLMPFSHMAKSEKEGKKLPTRILNEYNCVLRPNGKLKEELAECLKCQEAKDQINGQIGAQRSLSDSKAGSERS